MTGMQGMLQQAQKMQKEMMRIQEEAGKKTVEASAGGGMIKVVANGKGEVVSVTIDSEVLKMNDAEMLQDLIKAGVNEALLAAKKMVQDEMKGLTAGLGPLGSMLGM